MFAVVEIAGQQFEVAQNVTLNVPLLEGNAGDTVEFNNILVAGTNGNAEIGSPYIKGSVSAKIVAHGKGEKIIIFHKKRRKGYRKLNGHRQHFTTIEITNINI
jgi:large subunit ribosomal protein L21